MNPKLWGPHAWIFLHYITLGYPDCPDKQTKDAYKNFFINIKDILPCDTCKKHYSENIENISLKTYKKQKINIGVNNRLVSIVKK